MKVLMVSKALVQGAYHAKLREMAALGIELTLVVPPHWGSQKLEVRTADSYRIKITSCVLSGHNHFHFYWRLAGVVDADIVHVDEEPWSLVTYQCINACVKQHKPTLFFSWENIYKTYPPPFNYFQWFVLRHADAAIAGNAEARDILETRQFAKPIAVIPQFGVDPDVFAKRDVVDLKMALGLLDKFVIGYVGRVVKEKGIADLIRALASLPEECVLVIVGNGPFARQAEQLSTHLGISHRIRWISQISSLDVPDYMNLFDVLVLPSRTTSHWKEQFGRVLIEAMSCETAIVGSNSGEIPQVIGEAGLLFPEGDVESLTHLLCRLQASPRLKTELGKQGRARVLEKFTHRRIAQETLKVYRQVLSLPERIRSTDWDEAQVRVTRC
jgi:glycosyltransferase involved in cell wall biosynthesis